MSKDISDINEKIIRSCKKLYDKKIISYKDYMECKQKINGEPITGNLNSKLNDTYEKNKTILQDDKTNSFNNYQTRVENLKNEMKNTNTDNESINKRYETLINEINEIIQTEDVDLSDDTIYKTMLSKNKELSDNTSKLNNQLSELETMTDKNSIAQNKYNQNITVYYTIISIMSLCVLFIIYKLFSYSKAQEIISV